MMLTEGVSILFFAFLLAPTEMVVVEKIDKKTWGLSGDFKYLSIKKVDPIF